MIRSFKCKETERIWQGQSSRKFPGDIQDRALRNSVNWMPRPRLKTFAIHPVIGLRL